MKYFKNVGGKIKCLMCGSEDVIIFGKVPWSVNGLIPKQIMGFKCEKCGFFERFDQKGEK